MQKINLQFVVWKEGKYYVSQCLNIDVSSFGKTKREAIENLQEAVELYFEDEPIDRAVKIEKPDVVSRQMTYA